MQDHVLSVFSAQALTDSDAVSAAKKLPASIVSLLGTLASFAGGATSVTFSIEVSKDGSTDWRPQPVLSSPTEAAGVATSALEAFQFTFGAATIMPPISFEPELPYFRVKAKTNAGTATVTMTAQTKVEA